jgi:hypothetical protein
MGHVLTPGEKAWLIMAGGIASYDIWAMTTDRCTMTEAWRTALVHPKNRWIVIAAWGFTTKHLFFGEFAKWLDPFSLFVGITYFTKKLNKEKYTNELVIT